MTFLVLIVALSIHVSRAFTSRLVSSPLSLPLLPAQHVWCCHHHIQSHNQSHNHNNGTLKPIQRVPQISKNKSQTSRKYVLHLSSNDDGDVIGGDDSKNNSNLYDFDDEQLSEESRKRFEQMTKEFLADDGSDFPSAMPRNPFKSSTNTSTSNSKSKFGRAGKESLYSDDELMALLSIHNELNDELNDDDATSTASTIEEESFSLHDLVMRATGDDDEINPTSKSIDGALDVSVPPGGSSMNTIKDAITLDKSTKQKISQIKAIASDVDGTILTNRQTIHPRTRMAIKRAINLAADSGRNSNSGDCNDSEDEDEDSSLHYFFPATGKSRKGAIDSLSKASIEIGSLIEDHCPGVFLQGLFCVDQFGNVVFEKKLNYEAIDAAERLVAETGVSVVAYDGDSLYTTEQTDIVVHLHEHYGEPLPVLLPVNTVIANEDEKDNIDDNADVKVRKLSSHQPSMHKLLILDDDTNKLSNEVRPKLEELASRYDACVTQALPTMLELLPRDCSKALGVQKLCEALSINVADELIAIGDAENDAGMLKAACIGVAVGNACPMARDAADFVLNESNDEGGAGVAIEMFALNSLTQN